MSKLFAHRVVKKPKIHAFFEKYFRINKHFFEEIYFNVK